MRILFVWPVCHFSVWDVARGHRAALARLVGEENIRDYRLDTRTDYHIHALPEDVRSDTTLLAKCASETVICEALYFNADLVFVVSGLNFHPIGFWLLNKVKIPSVILFTESPYEDENQAEFASACDKVLCMTNDRFSAEKFGWTYVPHSYDPEIHKPTDPVDQFKCDVVMVGTGWKERQALLEQVNWSGIDFRLFGVWPDLTPESPIYKYHDRLGVNNERINRIYCSSKISVNIHRPQGDVPAYSIGPRLFEVAACETFQLSDYRPELNEVFGDSIPSFRTAEELEQLIRYYLKNDSARRQLAAMSRVMVKDCTFDKRASHILESISTFVSPSREFVHA